MAWDAFKSASCSALIAPEWVQLPHAHSFPKLTDLTMMLGGLFLTVSLIFASTGCSATLFIS